MGQLLSQRSAVILAGGQSRRFGSDKTQATFKGVFLMDILTKTLEVTGHKIFLSGQKDHLSRWGFPVIEDTHVYEGPLYALRDILEKILVPQVLVVACDMPFLTLPVIEALWSGAKKSKGVILEKGFPLPGIYSREMLPSIKSLIMDNRHDLKSLLEKENKIIYQITGQQLKQIDPSYQALQNINTPDDFDHINRGKEVPSIL